MHTPSVEEVSKTGLVDNFTGGGGGGVEPRTRGGGSLRRPGTSGGVCGDAARSICGASSALFLAGSGGLGGGGGTGGISLDEGGIASFNEGKRLGRGGAGLGGGLRANNRDLSMVLAPSPSLSVTEETLLLSDGFLKGMGGAARAGLMPFLMPEGSPLSSEGSARTGLRGGGAGTARLGGGGGRDIKTVNR